MISMCGRSHVGKSMAVITLPPIHLKLHIDLHTATKINQRLSSIYPCIHKECPYALSL